MTAPPFPVTDHCNGNRFFNPGHHVNHGLGELLRWKLGGRAEPWPKLAKRPSASPLAARSGAGFVATWINHSTFLLQTPAGNALIDPVFSPRIGPVSWLGPKRYHPPGLAFDALPKIDAVLVSHDHYDHCDLPTLARLARAHAPVGIAPLGNGPLLRRAGFRRVVELDWWKGDEPVPGLAVTLTPARHWCNRLRGARNSRLWGGFYLRWPSGSAFHAGDTAADTLFFREIHARLHAPDLAMLPIGGYEPRWFMAPQHCSPAEAVQIHLDLGSRQSVGMHWGCFRLTDEEREAPVSALKIALAKARLAPASFRALAPGESVVLTPTAA
jgi:L-ascorbate metabolism protein UlaG (beta-lactamase superfamily)